MESASPAKSLRVVEVPHKLAESADWPLRLIGATGIRVPRIALNSARKTLMLAVNAWLTRLAMLDDGGALVAVAVLVVARRVVTDAASIVAANTSTCAPDSAAAKMPLNAAVIAVLTKPISLLVVAVAGCCLALVLCAVCLDAVAWNKPADAAAFFLID